MNLIIIHGPPAVGKMTVGRALAERLDYKLFFNHMSLDLVNEFFDFGTEPFKRLDKKIRFALFEEIAKSDLPGLVFTYVWAVDFQSDEDYVDQISDLFKSQGAEVHIVELSSSLDIRRDRNKHPDRLAHKPTKRDLVESDKNLMYFENNYRMNSTPEEFPDKNILRINNDARSPDQVAEQIINHFGL